VRAVTLAMLLLTMSPSHASAQVFFVQGEDGATGERGLEGPAGEPVLDCIDDTCTLTQDLVVTGSGTFDSIEAVEADIDALTSEDLTVAMSIWLPECPSGYVRDRECETCDQIVLCVRGLDEMVKVGDFWVDRYEASVWETAECGGDQYGDTDDWPTGIEAPFPYHGSFTTPLHACSVRGVTPSRWLTWFQAQSACAASGKSLLTNAEWQAAVAGTVDPNGNTEDGPCLDRPREGPHNPRLTGTAGDTPGGVDSCISYWGAEDMVGNLWEWVEDWYGQGPDSGADGSQPSAYFGDGYWNVDAAEVQGSSSPFFPATAYRGGDFMSWVESGAFAMSLDSAPSRRDRLIGFRCAIH